MTKGTTIEILAPAGNESAARAAVFSGADALYMGGSLFSARASAVNFSPQELEATVKFAHVRGVKCYVTVNTLLKEDELAEAMAFVTLLCTIPVDGILVQDMGLFRLLKSHCPQMPLHISTQGSIHSPAGARLVKELGASRVVLARELSLDEIAEIHGKVDIELEAFVHGALCMSVSGQCYFSAMLGGRSGNRGRCAQPCRLPFAAPGGTGHDLSLKDMSFIKELRELAAAGVVSAKIEGRMKRPEYVAAATAAARKVADGEEIPTELFENLEAVFSRSGFTSGYLYGRLGKEMFGIRTQEDVQSGTSAVFGTLHELYKNELQRIPLTVKISVQVEKLPVLTIDDEDGHTVSVSGEFPAETAINRPLNEERLTEQLKKLGGTPYYAKAANCHTDGLSALPMSAVNAMRRAAIDEMNALREKREPIPVRAYSAEKSAHQGGTMTLRAVFSSLSQAPAELSALEWVYLPMASPNQDFVALLKRHGNVGAELPRAFFGVDDRAKERILALAELGVGAFMCGSLGAVQLCREAGVPIHGGFSLNITNSQSLKFFEEMGVSSAELSFELTRRELGRIGGTLTRGIMIYGRQALMLVRNCPIAGGGCLHCKKPQVLTDRMGAKFPVICAGVAQSEKKGQESHKSTQVFNSLPLCLSDKLGDFLMSDFGVLRFTVENHVETSVILDAFIRQESPQYDYTRGLFYRGVL